jgi:hypothetical protein
MVMSTIHAVSYIYLVLKDTCLRSAEILAFFIFSNLGIDLSFCCSVCIAFSIYGSSFRLFNNEFNNPLTKMSPVYT